MRNKFRIGDIVKSRYRSPWIGVILSTKIGWVNRLNQEVVLYKHSLRNYKDRKHSLIPDNERNRTHYLPENCHIVKVIKDKSGNPLRKPIYKTLHKNWLELIQETSRTIRLDIYTDMDYTVYIGGHKVENYQTLIYKDIETFEKAVIGMKVTSRNNQPTGFMKEIIHNALKAAKRGENFSFGGNQEVYCWV